MTEYDPYFKDEGTGMTDRDLYTCGDFNCDGHARINDRCPEYIDCVESKPCPYPHCDYDPEVDGQHRHNYPPKPAPTYTVSGNALRIFRLDPEGNPIGEAVEFPGPVSFDIPEGTVSDAAVFTDAQGFSNITLDIEMGQVSPEILALLTGQGTPPEEMMLVTLPKYPRLRFAAYCLRRWTIDLVADGWRWLRRCERWWFSMGGK